MKKLLLILTCITLTLSFSNCSKTSKYKVVVEQLNQQLPMDLPGGIRMEKAEVDGDEFKYTCTFLEEPTVSADDLLATKDAIVTMVKNQSDLKVFRDDKMTITFAYKKNDGSLYAEIKVTPEDYQ